MDKGGMEKQLAELAGTIAARNGFELVATEASGSARNLTVRVFIDKPGGVSVEDCATVSRELGALLEEKDLIPTSYTLEVSSPGLDRPLTSLADFERFKGSLAKLRTYEPLDGQRNFKGTIEGTDGDTVVLVDKTAGTVRIPHALIGKANLEIDMEAELGRKR
jgi:ribosome maturation factor RimP